ncbi:TetR/AcrR family transcriptional regulator [Archangium violaceum]|uniref:TetR/AcrR family transcriptional regulator n=1 Tax=Archangium violaceum TaxID=83451 RepID=UPI0036DF0EE8
MNRDSAKRARAPRLRARLREATGDAIRAAAEEVLGEQGFGARMEDIAERAGVSVGTLYNHFEDRNALLRELIRVRREALLAQLDVVVAEVEGRPFREQLRALLEKVFKHFHQHARFFANVMQSEVIRPGPSPRGGTLSELTTRVELLVQRGVAAGELRREGSELYATLLVGMARSLLMRAAETKRPEELERDAHVLLQVFLKGIEV